MAHSLMKALSGHQPLLASDKIHCTLAESPPQFFQASLMPLQAYLEEVS